MISKNKFVVSECVSKGHPDKIADQIADAILDAYLEKDKKVRAGIEVMIKDNVVVLGGEISSNATINYDGVVRGVFKDLDFPENHHLSYNDIKIINLIGQQSQEIHNGVDIDDDVIGAGDQGFMVGYASDETPTLMPLGHYIAKKICDYVSAYPELGPDTKTQVIIECGFEEVKIHSILVSTMHQYSLEHTRQRVEDIIKNNWMGIEDVIFNNLFKDKDIKIDINPCGSWRIGGPVSDCGVTGRKLVVDSYGGYCNIGGGNFSGKDMSKVDRSAAYMARYLAKNIVASGWCNRAKVTLSYMIGVPEPCSIEIETNTYNSPEELNILKEWIYKNVDLTPKGIIERFEGTKPQFRYTSELGHFGIDETIPSSNFGWKWEKIDIAEEINKLFIGA